MTTGELKPTARTYRPHQPVFWWLRRPNYLFYMVREFTVVPMAAWLLWFLWEIWKLHNHQFTVQSMSTGFVIFSVICLLFALYHSITFLLLSGMIIRIPIGDRFLAPNAIKFVAIGGLVAGTVVISALLILFGIRN